MGALTFEDREQRPRTRLLNVWAGAGGGATQRGARSGRLEVEIRPEGNTGSPGGGDGDVNQPPLGLSWQLAAFSL